MHAYYLHSHGKFIPAQFDLSFFSEFSHISCMNKRQITKYLAKTEWVWNFLLGQLILLPLNVFCLSFSYFTSYPSAWFVFDFFLFHIEIEGNCGWIIGGGGGGGGGGGVDPLSNYWVGSPPTPHPHLPTPMKHLNNKTMDTKHRQTPHLPPLFLRLWSTWTTKQLTPNIGRYRKSICSRKF